MASESTIATNDLRSAAVEYQRDRNSKHKWALGPTYGPGRREADGNARPYRHSQSSLASVRKAEAKYVYKCHAHSKRPLLEDDTWDYSDYATDPDIVERSVGPAPDAEITYSYDAPSGPTRGSQVLGRAVEDAFERFELRETDKLVQAEYEVLDSEGEAVSGQSSKARKGGRFVDDEYEFV